MTVAVLYGNGKADFFPKTRLNGTMPWVRQAFEFTTPDADSINGKRPHDIRLLMTEAYGTVWFSDVRLDDLGPAVEAQH